MIALARLLGLSLALSSLAACSSARIVHDTRTGGTVALRGPRGSAQDKAEALMREKCPEGWSVVEQAEVPYGETSQSYTSYSPPPAGRRSYGSGSAWTSTRTTAETEWQITFHCEGAQASAAPYVVRF